MRVTSHNLPSLRDHNSPTVTVFCAVWHKQPNKLELLKSHLDNLKQQSIPVEPCYIFDNGDTAPDWLNAPWHSFSKPLTIYEAWAAGVALTRTRYVMNLNMDDRLATDAVELMLNGLRSQNASLIGGEWIIDFDHAFQTERFSSSDVQPTKFAPDWPPIPLSDGEQLRLGSGTSERGTFGPATLWDLERTERWYPSYFGNREPILSIGDGIFWKYLLSNGHKLVRLSRVIGRYYSSPDAQAEFKPHNDNETLRLHGVHKVSFAQQVSASQGDTHSKPKSVDVTLPAPRSAVETHSQALAVQYLAMFGRRAKVHSLA
ncbi:MAG: glycosyltransferase family 2 protein [Epibacterium sp.]|nr:glycosyltransferase family 2 protein [Epibacterium sp.]NQX72052.1 glycosyltransferase family 2 protein [Epibacterium sp.]